VPSPSVSQSLRQSTSVVSLNEPPPRSVTHASGVAEPDRAAWGQRALRFRPEFAAVARRLQDALGPLGRSQIVHADLTRNVLFAVGSAPVVIESSPYWRPPAFAEVVVTDALCWHGADASLPNEVNVLPSAVARALLFRMAATNERAADGIEVPNLRGEADRYAFAAPAIGV
jgi:hypothetical protein